MKVVTAGQVTLAVALADFKAARHIDADDTDDDTLLTAYLTTAQELVEAATNRPMTSRDLVFTISTTPVKRWWFPVAPITALKTVESIALDGTATSIDLTSAGLEMGWDEPRIQFPENFIPWGDPTILQITATAGDSAINQIERMKQAIILLTNEWYLAGIALDAVKAAVLTAGPAALVRSARYNRPQETEEFQLQGAWTSNLVLP